MLLEIDISDESHLKFTYQLMQERYQQQYKDNINIKYLSSETLPSYYSHVKWIKKHGSGNLRLYKVGDDFAALVTHFEIQDVSADITINNEIGIFVLERYWGKGIGYECLKEFLSQNPDLVAYAKINPNNTRSINLFKKLGFECIAQIWRNKNG